MAREKDLAVGEAARAIGVSVDTLRRWDRAGKLRTHRDADNRRLVPAGEVRRLRAIPERHRTGAHLSARNRMLGRVEIEAGPFLLTAAVTRDSIEELGLREGDEVVALVKATSMMIEKS